MTDPIDFVAAFSDPKAVAQYAEGPPRFVPGFEALHRMTTILLAETGLAEGRGLVLGAGGGLELQALCDALPGWRFDGVDPAQPMLDGAARRLGARMARVDLHCGYAEDGPPGPYDAATCLLTLHFLGADDRRAALVELHRRLKPGAPLVVAHSAFPQGPGERDRWLARYAAFAVASGFDPALAEGARAAVSANLHLLDPEADAALMREAGFRHVELFYAAFTWRGWVAYA